jgi:putative Mg2+ transporter-C (MgtC) family protein
MPSGKPWRRRLPELSWAEVLLRVVLAAALGGAIGFERELREREAGLRTHMLVSVGAALFTIVSAYAWTDWRFSNASGIVFDPTRIAAQIVTGIGFLGAGAIIRQGLSVRGLTTAATLWVVAAIGMATGAGFYTAAVITTVLVILSLWPLRIVAYRMSERFRPEEGRLAVDLPAGASAVSVLEAVESAGASVESLEFEEEGDRRRVDMRVRVERGRSAAAVIDALTRAHAVKGARWNP